MNNTEKNVGIISKVAGPLIVAKNMKDVQMYDVVVLVISALLVKLLN